MWNPANTRLAGSVELSSVGGPASCGLLPSDLTSDAACVGLVVILIRLAGRGAEPNFRPALGLLAVATLIAGLGPLLSLTGVHDLLPIIARALAMTSVVIGVGALLFASGNTPARGRDVEASLREANRQLQLAEQIARVGHWRVAVPSRRLQWSDEVFRIYGLDPAAGVPDIATAISAYHPDDRQIVADNVEQAITHLREFTLFCRLRRSDGELRHVQSRGVPELGSDGAVIAVFGVFVDVTEQHQAAEARAQLLHIRARLATEASQAKSGFLANMSHELRTPLNGILGYAQLLRIEGGLNAVQGERVDAMLAAGAHLRDVINNVLDMSQIEAGHLTIEATDVDIRESAGACMDVIRPVAAAKGLALAVDISPLVPVCVSTDRMRLRQVLVNLLGNAIKFTATGRIELRARMASAGATLRLEVADTGPGIAPAEQDRLFEAFQRLGHVDARGVEGAGLGLSISARLVALMSGRIGYAANPAGGSIFWVELPMAVSPHPGLISLASPPHRLEAEAEIAV